MSDDEDDDVVFDRDDDDDDDYDDDDYDDDHGDIRDGASRRPLPSTPRRQSVALPAAAAAAARAAKPTLLMTAAGAAAQRQRKGVRTFRTMLAKAVESDSALSKFVQESGLLDNGKLGGVAGDEGAVAAEVDMPTGIRAVAVGTLSIMQSKKTCSFAEVAEALVHRVYGDAGKSHEGSRELRRRAYDVLNVLVSLGVVTKQKGRTLQWFGVPYGSPSEIEHQVHEREELRKRIEAKEARIRDLLVHQLALHNLQHSRDSVSEADRLALPFVTVTTPASGQIECEIARDHSQVCLTFSAPFEVRDDHEVLRMLRLHEVPEATVLKLVPPELFSYLPDALQPSLNKRALPASSSSSSAAAAQHPLHKQKLL